MRKLEIVLRDGIVITKKSLVLNINKERKYRITVNEKIVADNLLYNEMFNILSILRESEEK